VAVDVAFAASPQSGLAWLCFLFPLIEPDRRISRIRLSEKVSRFRPRKTACPSSKLDKAQHLMQGGNGELLGYLPSQFVLGAQPLSQPLASMSFDRSIGFADWSKAEIISPPNHHTIECLYHCFLGQKGLVPSGLLADRLTDALHPFLRGRRSSLRRVTASERISQEVELFFRQLADPVLVSFTVSFSFDIMFRIVTRASSA